MSWSRDEAAKPSSLASEPAMKREFFHWPKYSLIVGVIVTSACRASSRVGVHDRAALSRAAACLAKSRLTAATTLASGTASPNEALPSPSRSARTSLAWKSSLVPNSDVSVRKKKFPGFFRTRPSGRWTSNGTAFSGSEPSDPGIEDHVELRQLLHAGHHALGLLVLGVGLAPGLLHATDEPGDLLAVLGQQLLVVERHALGQLVVAAALARQLGRGRLQIRRVIGQVALDRAEPGIPGRVGRPRAAARRRRRKPRAWRPPVRPPSRPRSCPSIFPSSRLLRCIRAA